MASRRRFNWRLVLGLASLGLVFAVLTISGTLPGQDATMWAALGMLVIIGIVIALRAPARPLLHGFAAGFLAGLVAVETQALFLTTYFANNPQYAEIEIPFGWPPRLATAVLGPLNAALAGVITGVLAWALWKVRKAGSAA